MALKAHSRAYDIVVFGANGYTGTYIAEHIVQNLPSNLKWVLAGRSEEKLSKLADRLRVMGPDRLQPAIKVAHATFEDLDRLAKQTYVLIAAVGPYIKYGEAAFRACAENGTHYFDMTGEVPFMARMTHKYEKTAQATGAIMVPQCGIESAPADLVTWMIAKINRTQLNANTGDVTLALTAKSAPSGGTLRTLVTAFEEFSLKELSQTMSPFALSPVPKASPRRGHSSLAQMLTGVTTLPRLGIMTTSPAGSTDAAYVERTWGLLATIPSRKHEAYGPNFSFSEYLTTTNWLQGTLTHWSLALGGALMFTLPPLRWLIRRFVTQPGQGPSKEKAKNDLMEYRAIGLPDCGDDTTHSALRKKVSCKASFRGSMYELTAILISQGALTLLEDDVQLGGGVYTASILGQRYIDRLEKAKLRFEAEIVDVE